jgi:hypothetical protein
MNTLQRFAFNGTAGLGSECLTWPRAGSFEHVAVDARKAVSLCECSQVSLTHRSADVLVHDDLEPPTAKALADACELGLECFTRLAAETALLA